MKQLMRADSMAMKQLMRADSMAMKQLMSRLHASMKQLMRADSMAPTAHESRLHGFLPRSLSALSSDSSPCSMGSSSWRSKVKVTKTRGEKAYQECLPRAAILKQ